MKGHNFSGKKPTFTKNRNSSEKVVFYEKTQLFGTKNTFYEKTFLRKNLLLRKDTRLYPKGSPSRNSLKPETGPDKRGGLEIVFNQQ
ncbi:hypothetical protein AALP_AA3G318300 [Arabis alpina]|uniref:Uncharacterized protein n=1 Tax=Arabis alpina TaxID=50452 RepID=A0A087HD08_ARAAL|nr:hypothetical protein AALP_AA3G318300 [Arabis alpina]